MISDTHGLVRPAALAALAGCRHILHAGDIGKPEVIERLRVLAPVTAVRGNVDRGAWADAYPETALVTLGGHRIHLVHERARLVIDPRAAGVSVVISGHSHRPGAERSAGVLYLNPGAAGPRRFHLPVALARLHLSPGSVHEELVHLPSHEAAWNPRARAG